MDETTDNARKDALAFLRRHKTGVLATVSAGGEAHASMVFYTADEHFNVYFFTMVNTRKFAAIKAHPQVAFVVSTPEVPQTLQIEGLAVDIPEMEDTRELRQGLYKVLNSNNWFAGPIMKLDPANVGVMRLKPTWVRWADYAFSESGSHNVFKEIPLT